MEEGIACSRGVNAKDGCKGKHGCDFGARWTAWIELQAILLVVRCVSSRRRVVMGGERARGRGRGRVGQVA